MEIPKYAINTKDGRIVFRTPEVDDQVNYYPISMKIINAIDKGVLKKQDVLVGIANKIRADGDFDFEEYLKKLQKLNVRTSNISEKDIESEVDDRSEEESDLDDIVFSKASKEDKTVVPEGKGVPEKEKPEPEKQESPKKPKKPKQKKAEEFDDLNVDGI